MGNKSEVDILSSEIRNLFFQSSTISYIHNNLLEGCPDLSLFNVKVLSEVQYTV